MPPGPQLERLTGGPGAELAAEPERKPKIASTSVQGPAQPGSTSTRGFPRVSCLRGVMRVEREASKQRVADERGPA